MDDYDKQFQGMTQGLDMNEAPQATYVESPYGSPVVGAKPGLTKRGKVALGVAAVVIGGGGMLAYQSYSATQAEQETKAQEIALKMKALEIQELKARGDAALANRKAQAASSKALQASVDGCVKGSADLVGKGYGAPSKRDVLEDCQAQYGAGVDGSDMAPASSSKDAGAQSGGANSTGLLLGGGVLVVVLAYGARKGKAASAE